MDKKVEPYLFLVEESRLRAVKNQLTVPYGSKEDDNSASNSLSQIRIPEDQTKESCVDHIVKNLGDLRKYEASTIREQLLNEFIPDDGCPVGSLFMDDQLEMYLNYSENDKQTKEEPPEDFTDTSQMKNNSGQAMDLPNLPSAKILIDSVANATNEVGSLSVSTASEVSYQEMARQCEALQMAKKEKISHLMSTQQRQDTSNFCLQNNDEVKNMIHQSQFDAGSIGANTSKQGAGATEDRSNNPNSFSLPPANPYYQFLKAAGC